MGARSKTRMYAVDPSTRMPRRTAACYGGDLWCNILRCVKIDVVEPFTVRVLPSFVSPLNWHVVRVLIVVNWTLNTMVAT
jgi:hypothetical protein